MPKEALGMTETDPLLHGLNPVQTDAVLHEGGPLLVLAGAGSGKTRVLTRRVVHLIQHRNVRPERILAVTFTNKAAGEMRNRVESMLRFGASGLWIGTFHSICLRLVRRHSDLLGFSGAVTVFDQDDQTKVMKQVLRECGGGDAEAPRVRDLKNVISMAKNRLWEPDDLAEQWDHPDCSRLATLYREYQSTLRRQDGVDFDDLLVLGVRLLERNSDIAEAYTEKFEHILVDEYQDTNHVQYRLVRLLSARHKMVTVVGDDDQSIYGWRGADIRNILDFSKHYPDATTLRMTQNYRSTKPILDVANAVVAKNTGRLEKELWTEKKGGATVRLIVHRDEEEEARRLVQEMKQLHRDGKVRLKDVTILYRVHAQSRAFEEACLTHGLAYVIVGGIAFYQRREVKDVLAYLRLAENPLDQVSFHRAIAAPKRGIGNVSLAKIEQLAVQNGGDLPAACASLNAASGLRGKALQKAIDFGNLIADLRAHRDEGPEGLIGRVLDSTDYLPWLQEIDRSSGEERQANVLELQEGAGRFQEAVAENSLQAYLDQVALYTNLDQDKVSEDRVSMMTVHNAKGLEFPLVYIVGLEDGLFPHSSSFDDDAEMEEERRLFYVAATRAKTHLVLSASLDRRQMNRFAEGGLSRFLGDIPEDWLEVSAPGGQSLSALRDRAESWRNAGHNRYGGWNPGAASGAGRAPSAPRSSTSGQGVPARRAGPGSRDESRAKPSHHDTPLFASLDQQAPAADSGEAVIQRGSAPSMKGEKIRHAIFGIGTVQEEDGRGSDARLTIYFPGTGTKKILARFVVLVQ